MATKTGTQEERYKALDKSNRELIAGNRRTNVEIEAILDAMQAFKGGRLAGITLTPERHDLFRTCSMRVEECALDPKQLKFLTNCGVQFAGEVCYIVCNVRWHKTAAMLDSIMRSLGLPEGYDPLKKGWEPPYWSYVTFRNALAVPVMTYFHDYSTTHIKDARGHGVPFAPTRTWARRCHGRGVHFMGSYFADQYNHRGRAPAEMQWMEKGLQALETERSLWAGALLPPTWSPPLGVPECWKAEEADVVEEVRMYETPKAWVVERAGQRDCGTFGACIRYPGEVPDIRDWNHWARHLIGRRYSFHGPNRVLLLNGDTVLDVDGDPVCVGSADRIAQAFSTPEKARAFVKEMDLRNTDIDHNRF